MATGIRGVIALLLLCAGHCVFAQEPDLPVAIQNQLEREASASSMAPEDDAVWQHLDALTKHKISLNDADEVQLQSLGLLTPIQISNLLTYRKLLGNLVSIYELQAVPGFELNLIKRILPYVKVEEGFEPVYTLHDYLHRGDHSVLLRSSMPLEKAKGYLHTDSTLPHYNGSPLKLFIRYRYSLPRHVSWGITMEKDGGESFFSGAQRQGFDFYSAHFFIRDYRNIKALAIGDFTVNLGQGLLNWQSQAYGKGASVMQVKREGDILRPYTSAGEYYFFRGGGITLRQGAFQLTAFASWRQLDGTITSADTLSDDAVAAALISSGYHRSQAEVEKKGTLRQLSGGGAVRYFAGRWQVGVNTICHMLEPALQKVREPYNQFDFTGNRLYAASLDYSGTWKNMHLFGEAAFSNNGKPAVMQGLLVSIAPAADIALVYRYYDKGYQSFYAKGFGDNYRTVNEQGFYTAISLRPGRRVQLDAYADVFRFPWLKYRSSAPSGGMEFFLQGIYTSGKSTTALLRYTYRKGNTNTTVPGNPLRVLSDITSTSIRFQCSRQCGRQLLIKVRGDCNVYVSASGQQQGWLFLSDVAWKLRHSPFSVNARIARFLTDSYNTRIYAYESGVLYENAVSQLYGNGWQYYVNLKCKISRRMSSWIRFHQTWYEGVNGIGSGWDMINGHIKFTLQLQIQYVFP
ncbi:MAG TPA: helix-hairpin-helix domain-containing protein [Chitinophaga sp.]|uniref:ComEA family DNA-binding protein n=1 Tax=Chitinophaga sp. TaxID=1869181 RepID=UPI002C0484DF|nr:helix-hairpin-helix domain-containing protein [Chitinophaga sp.]HVI47415.1 helix-hairpin-helix domain-containing protein [Chitinophaga sp.]